MNRLPGGRRSTVLVALLVVLAGAGIGVSTARTVESAGGTAGAADQDAGTVEQEGATAERALVVSDADSGRTLLSVPVENGTVVALNYTHSVERTPVSDVYVVAGDHLLMTRMEFDSYGWGLPANENVTRANGSYAFDPAWEGEELYVKPGRVAGHTLRIGERSYDLVALSDARSVRLHVAVRPQSTAPLGAHEP